MAATEAQPPSLPDYPKLIMAAIESLGEKEGSNKSAISNHIQFSNPDLPTAHSTLLSYTLNKMKLSGQLVFAKNNYLKPDPNAPPKRGRGRPPKTKQPGQPGETATPSSSRPRGRPPKSRDPLAPVTELKKKPSSGKPRGRPPKNNKPAAKETPATVTGGVKRGRGRPPKLTPATASVGA